MDMNKPISVVGWVVKQGSGFHEGLLKSLFSSFEERVGIGLLG